MGRRVDYEEGQRERVYQRDHGRCKICGVKVGNDPKDRAWELHHINGDSSFTIDWNLEVRCIYCHNRAHKSRWGSVFNWLTTNVGRRAWVNGKLRDRERIVEYAQNSFSDKIDRMRSEQ
jgi:5-methylcytosine-specific restriction endonuclease McrA